MSLPAGWVEYKTAEGQRKFFSHLGGLRHPSSITIPKISFGSCFISLSYDLSYLPHNSVLLQLGYWCYIMG